jgi:regulator of nucleoside diphosphate kinase
MLNDNFILSTKDFTILEAMCDNPLGHFDLLVPLIRRKIDRAIVVFRDDLPREVASINSRVAFSVNGGESDTRVLSTGQLTAPVGMVLPITTARGLALLGLGEGQHIVWTNAEGVEERILLHKVEYQPEASRRERRAFGQQAVPLKHKPMLRIVPGGISQAHSPIPVTSDGHDDPGPSAA